ncbi:hypothetical protein C0J52_01501 [Blattella germanica]|nr:hypothetical protein C0J52_01501 [Blattella germanica]
MPALKLFARKWLVASDDLVFPGIFEFVFRFIWILLLLPEVGWNIMGTMWIFCNHVQCSGENFTTTVTEGLVLFNWVLFALTIFGLAVVFDPLGSTRFNEQESTLEALRHRKVTRLWLRRLQWTFCWMRRDKHGNDAFYHMANLFSSLFRSTDTVPSDYMAGFILMRVRQKRETRELRRLQLLDEQQPIYTLDARKVMAEAPDWMSLELAQHFLKLATAAYSWPFVMYRHPFTGLFKLISEMTCCSCLRYKSNSVRDDNCCLCSLAGVRYLSMISPDDILFSSFRNRIFEMPYFVMADHKTGSIVISIRGSISMRDVFTDMNANAEKFEAEGLPPNSMAHRGMAVGAQYIKTDLEELGILEKAFGLYPHYKFVVTAGVLSREAARYTEDFVLTYRIMLNGFGYAMFGVPTRDLETIWKSECTTPQVPGQLPLLLKTPEATQWSEESILAREVPARRFSRTRLFTPGRILHITRRKKTAVDQKTNDKTRYAMRWAIAEEFTQIEVMPRMLLDHLPENVDMVLDTILQEQRDFEHRHQHHHHHQLSMTKTS